MFLIMIQKLWHKKWMVFCVLIGTIFLIAIAVSNPMYKTSSFQRILMEEFDRYRNEKGVWPAGFSTKITMMRGISSMEEQETKAAINNTIEKANLPIKEYISWYEVQNQRAASKLIRDGKLDKVINIAAITDFMEHIEVIYGRLPETKITEDGYIEVVVSEAAMVYLDLLMEDEYEYRALTNEEGETVKIRIVGVFKAKDDSDVYWVTPDSEMETQVFMDMDLFQSVFQTGKKESIKSNMLLQWYVLWDYTQIKASDISRNVRDYQKGVNVKALNGKVDDKVFQTIFEDYTAKVKRIDATLTILQIPVIFLLCAFIYMISNQMLQMEQNEISLLKSRGAKKSQIILLYLMQSTFLSVISFVIGAPIGRMVCGFLGSSTAFLEFKGTNTLEVLYTKDIFLYGLGAIFIAIAMITIPVIKYSGISIVHLKQNKAKKRKTLWKKVYLDLICIAVSLYGYYSFLKNEKEMVENVLLGDSMNPLLYVSFSLFILGCGLLVCRIQPYLLKICYKIVKNKLKPAAYVSIIETIRSSYKQEFIILFMILTVAIGISNTILARTIIANTTSNTEHVIGAEIVLQELWKNNSGAMQMGAATELIYYEPEYIKYNTIPGVEENTKVLKRNVFLKEKKEDIAIELMGIETKGFSQITKMQEGLLPYDFHSYLNVLANDNEGVLVSENFMTVLGYKIGDAFTVEDLSKNRFKVTIRGIIPYWPSYIPDRYEVNSEETIRVVDNYLVIGNLHAIQNAMNLYPYQVWMKVSDEGKGLYEWINRNKDITILSIEDRYEILNGKLQDTLIQGTIGNLSMSFIVILLLCSVGYLIYWIMSIRSRELLFGVLRAMGMRKKEIIWMLLLEQVYSGLFAIIAGGLVGILSSNMFVPMIQKAYAASDQVLPLELVTKASDNIQLFLVIGIVLFVCLLILAKIVSKMNISKALKLGED